VFRFNPHNLSHRLLSLVWLLVVAAPTLAVDPPQTIGLDYLNTLRASAGMSGFNRNAALETAAVNHSNYQSLNDIIGHFEDPTLPGFTGEYPSDRVVYAGYLSTYISENVSSGNTSVTDSIDGLMSAIYHRFGFLAVDLDEIGIGIEGDYYTYDMGNSLLNSLCAGTSFNGSGYYYFEACADPDFRIEESAFDGAVAQIADANPAIVQWPPPSARDIPPVFYEEIPDPLPGHSVTGYPVSVEFNPWLTQGSVSVQKFALFDDSDTEVVYAHKVLQATDDVNNLFTEYQFAVFPLSRLEWGRTYRAQLDYRIGGGAQQSLDWRFTTRGLPYRYYQFEDLIADEVTIVSGQTYSLYFVPSDSNDVLSGYTYSYYVGMGIDTTFYDANTINIRVTGSPGQQVILDFDTGQQLTLTIAASDTALDNSVPPDTDMDGLNDDVDNCPATPNSDQLDTDNDMQGDACDVDDDGDGLSDIDETEVQGTDPLLSDTDGDGMDDLYEVNNGLDPLVDDAAADKDGDGLSNFEEFQAGSDPADPTDPNAPVPAHEMLQVIVPYLLD